MMNNVNVSQSNTVADVDHARRESQQVTSSRRSFKPQEYGCVFGVCIASYGSGVIGGAAISTTSMAAAPAGYSLIACGAATALVSERCFSGVTCEMRSETSSSNAPVQNEIDR